MYIFINSLYRSIYVYYTLALYSIGVYILYMYNAGYYVYTVYIYKKTRIKVTLLTILVCYWVATLSWSASMVHLQFL